jgi:hypothetical protein
VAVKFLFWLCGHHKLFDWFTSLPTPLLVTASFDRLTSLHFRHTACWSQQALTASLHFTSDAPLAGHSKL